MLEFEKRDRPADMLQLLKRLYNAEGIMLTAPDADAVVRHVSRVSAKLLEGYPGGQMLAWRMNYRYLVASRPADKRCRLRRPSAPGIYAYRPS